jgi:hypothetical protein
MAKKNLKVTHYQALGNIPAISATFYKETKPELKVGEGERATFLRFKVEETSETEGKKRESIALVVPQFTIAKLRDCEKGSEFLLELVNEQQDSNAKACAESKAQWNSVVDPAEMIREYFDNTRTASGGRVTAEVVGKFFDASMVEWMTARVQAKFPQFDSEKIDKVVAQYRQSFCDLSKYQMPHTKAVFGMLQKAWLEFLAENVELEFDTEMADWINIRMKKLEDRNNEEAQLMAI